MKKEIPFLWSSDCQDAFNTLKGMLTGDTFLAFPDNNKQFVLATDASKTGFDACLSQQHNGVLSPVGFTGRSFTIPESNYTTAEQELLSVDFGIQHFKVYLTGKEFELCTDHSALKWVLSFKEPKGRLAGWVTLPQTVSVQSGSCQGQRQYRIRHTEPLPSPNHTYTY